MRKATNSIDFRTQEAFITYFFFTRLSFLSDRVQRPAQDLPGRGQDGLRARRVRQQDPGDGYARR